MKQVITFGEIMMRLSPPGSGRLRQTDTLDVTFGGGEANVAVALAVMGVPAAHVTALPDSELGQATAGAFRRYGVDMRHTVFNGQRLGLYFLETGTAMRASRIIYDRDRSAFAELDPAAFDWERILAGAGWLHWTGISPAISAAAATACRDAIRTARRLGLTISADVNYRRNLWQYGQSPREVMPELVAECDVLVCGTGDAADIFDVRTEEEGAEGFAAAARRAAASTAASTRKPRPSTSTPSSTASAGAMPLWAGTSTAVCRAGTSTGRWCSPRRPRRSSIRSSVISTS